MLKHILLFVIVVLACAVAAPTSSDVVSAVSAESPVEPKLEAKAVPTPKALLISDLKTPASTAKLSGLVAPIAATPLISPISRIAYTAPILPQLAPYAYAYSAPIAPVEVAAAPSSYSIEQHGYQITY